MKSCVDFANDLVYIWDLSYPSKVKVYDYDGYMQREFTITSDIPTPNSMYIFDENRLIVYCDPTRTSVTAKNLGPYQYWLIDINTGKATPINIKIPDAISNSIRKHIGEHVTSSAIAISPMLRSNNKVVISDYTYPIVYLQEGTQLKPLLRKSENTRSNTQETMSVVKAITDRYILFYVAKKNIDRDKCIVSIDDEAEILYDRLTKEICEVEFINPDTGKLIRLDWDGDMPHNTIVAIYPTLVLERYKNNGYLTGKLKEIVENMDPEDNPVLAIITFK